MQYPNVSATRPAESVGEIIDKHYALQLIQGFKEKFPGEIAEILIETKTIFKSVGNLSNISGIRFMYGMEKAGDPASKIILLIPCHNTSGNGAIPNAIVQPEGYLDHRGERVGLKRTWELLYNHAVHYAGFLPEIKFSKIFRGDFFGIDSLTSLLRKNRKAHSVKYHFGFDAGIADLPLRHKPVLNPLSADGTSYDVYLDLSALCPPMCGDPNDPTCVVTDTVNGNAHVNVQEKELNIYRIYRDSYFLRDSDNGPLVEMYYYVSPALTEAIISTGRSKEIYTELYHNQVRQCNQFIKRGMYEAAKKLFERTMEDLMKEYLFRENA